MCSRTWFPVTMGVLLLAAFSLSAAEELKTFKVVSVDGQVEVKVATATDFAPAQPNTVYEFGTSVRTGRNSTAVMELSPGNQFRLLGKALIEVTPAAVHPKLVRIALKYGVVNANLDQFPKDHGFEIETPIAACSAAGTRFTVEYSIDANDPNRKTFAVDCTQGQVAYTNTWGGQTGAPPTMIGPNGNVQMAVKETANGFVVSMSVGQGTTVSLGGNEVNLAAGTVIEMVVTKNADGTPNFGTNIAFQVASGTATVGGNQVTSASGAGYVSSSSFSANAAAAQTLTGAGVSATTGALQGPAGGLTGGGALGTPGGKTGGGLGGGGGVGGSGSTSLE